MVFYMALQVKSLTNHPRPILIHTVHRCTNSLQYSKESQTKRKKKKKIRANYFVCTVAQLPGSPGAAVIDLSSPFLQHAILSLLPLSGVCQRDQVANTKDSGSAVKPHQRTKPRCSNENCHTVQNRLNV